jgi:hypothetical protein
VNPLVGADPCRPTSIDSGISSKVQSKEKSPPIHTNDDIESTSDSLEGSDNRKSDDWYHMIDYVNEGFAKPDDHKESMRTVTHDEITVCSDKELSFENE